MVQSFHLLVNPNQPIGQPNLDFHFEGFSILVKKKKKPFLNLRLHSSHQGFFDMTFTELFKRLFYSLNASRLIFPRNKHSEIKDSSSIFLFHVPWLQQLLKYGYVLSTQSNLGEGGGGEGVSTSCIYDVTINLNKSNLLAFITLYPFQFLPRCENW